MWHRAQTKHILSMIRIIIGEEDLIEAEVVVEIEEIEAGVEADKSQLASYASNMGMMPITVGTDLIQTLFNLHLHLMKDNLCSNFLILIIGLKDKIFLLLNLLRLDNCSLNLKHFSQLSRILIALPLKRSTSQLILRPGTRIRVPLNM